MSAFVDWSKVAKSWTVRGDVTQIQRRKKRTRKNHFRINSYIQKLCMWWFQHRNPSKQCRSWAYGVEIRYMLMGYAAWHQVYIETRTARMCNRHIIVYLNWCCFCWLLFLRYSQLGVDVFFFFSSLSYPDVAIKEYSRQCQKH